ncbi:BlaI/MecI/CopY family transcriptional regulator [Paenibacillus sp. SC116]|uniref:BlaI/MecI/CopY family transcriptional regulator n=1 Tax=Paenibacillus sp. SC116 TaxID=2968986 RepID=UPI00215B466F|nr:BlaI/MecI/CopY family transcriptional regulator [Paenibacillus sp. SC116]MCR8842336.1 BlaI/MecI/CopY family transcriptional regulator [Paenibacillus sp. SC116]
MRELPRISEAEWAIMKIFWTKSPMTANEVIDMLADNKEWKPTTIRSLISRLLKKEALGFEQDGKTYFYYPLVSKEECIKAESTSFLHRLYGGALKPMFVNFLKQEKLTEDEVEELKKLLDERNQ